MSGDEDRATQSLRRRALSRALLSFRADMTVDLSGLEVADSSLMRDLALLAQRLRQAGRTPLYVVAEDNEYSIRLAEAVGFDDTGHREYVGQAVRPMDAA